MRRVPHANAVLRGARIRNEQAREQRRELSGLPPSCPGTGEERTPRLRDIERAPDGRELPKLSRADLPAIPPQPPCRNLVGRGFRREGAHTRASEFLRAVSARRNE